MSDNVTNDEKQQKKTFSFQVSPSEYNVLQQYAQIFHNQVVEDPEKMQPRRLLERPEIGLLIRIQMAYLIHYDYIM